MNSFWQTWRKEIIRGAVLFVGVIAVGFFVRSTIGRVRVSVANSLPVALRNLGDLQELKNLKNHFEIDPSAGPRDTADTWTYHGKIAPRQWVWIGNTNGSVTVEAAKGDSLEVVAVKTHHRSDPASVRMGQRVRLAPLRVADEPKGAPRWLPAFTTV